MKKIKLVLLALMCLLLTTNVFGFKNGDRVEIPEMRVTTEGSILEFSLPTGEYPKDSKIVLYARKNVFCPSPGFNPGKPTDDKNPYTLLGEYKFTSDDITSLKAGETWFTVTTKFDPECGETFAKVVSSKETAKPNEKPNDDKVTIASDKEGNTLKVYENGMQVSVSLEIVGDLLFVTLPKGSYILGDYFTVINTDGIVIASQIITEEMITKLSEGAIELRLPVTGITSVDNLGVVISDSSYPVGEKIDSLINPDANGDIDIDENNKGTNSLFSNPIFVGVSVFVLVMAVGLLAKYLDKLRKDKQTNQEKK